MVEKHVGGEMNMYSYHFDVLDTYRKAEKRANIYQSVIKEHKKELRKHKSESKEYKEIKEMIKFIKQMDDYRKVYRDMIVSMFALYRPKFN